LGTDELGRDVLSRLLSSLGATLRIVLIVAAIRLIFGTIIGLLSGWSTGKIGRLLSTLTSFALSVPAIFIALCAIAAGGKQLGVWAFIIGLAITGWAEVASLINEQTHQVKGQHFIEAARALGASDIQIVGQHILNQIVPLMWILFSFELSSTLLTLAGLGFLGYFINAIWVPGAGDFDAIRASGQPELGQMLAIDAGKAMTQPWSMAAAGSLVFIMVLGFNLLGDGLRLQINLVRQSRQKGKVSQALERIGAWIQEQFYDPLLPWRRIGLTTLTAGSLFIIIFSGGFRLLKSYNASLVSSPITVPGDYPWASAWHDAQGTKWIPISGPSQPKIVWVFRDSDGFTGGPVVTSNGVLYLTTVDAKLYAVRPDGMLLWKIALLQSSIGSPVIGASGTIYVVDQKANLYAVNPDGTLLWWVKAEGNIDAISGPITTPDEKIIYPTSVNIIAVSSQGQVIWKKNLPTFSYTTPVLRISLDGEMLFFEDTVQNTNTGDPFIEKTYDPQDRYIVGADGKNYVATPTTVYEFILKGKVGELRQVAKWDPRVLNVEFRILNTAGVTPSGDIWLDFGSYFEFSRVLWINSNGQVSNVIDYPFSGDPILIALDKNNVIYMCGTTSENHAECRATRAETGIVAWKIIFDKGTDPLGGALVPGRIYVTTANGYLYALEEK
jgi:ABC-type dipeptide/oligopeptide/nickel transport system permease subunit/outer membrane protein assembly factor BamB